MARAEQRLPRWGVALSIAIHFAVVAGMIAAAIFEADESIGWMIAAIVAALGFCALGMGQLRVLLSLRDTTGGDEAR